MKEFTHPKIYILIRDEELPPQINQNGQTIFPVKWIKVDKEVNLGSVNKPTPGIFKIKIDTREPLDLAEMLGLK